MANDIPDIALLARDLAEAGLIASGAEWVPLSGGRTNHLWRVQGGGQPVVVKLFSAQQANPLFPNDPQAEATLLRHLGGRDLAPDLLGQCATALGHCLVYGHLAGAPWDRDVAPVAAALARLHRTPAPAGLRRAPDGSAQIAAQTLAILAVCDTPAADSLRARCPSGEVAASQEACLLHGDAVPGNLIVTAAGIRLIDWQCPAVGDPCEDLAVFLSPAMQFVNRGAALSADEVDAFLQACAGPALRDRYRALAPWYHWRMAAYCLWKDACGAPGYRRGYELEVTALEVLSGPSVAVR